ncbi:CU044_5270 family protein [Streptomyces sp. S1A(2023)]
MREPTPPGRSAAPAVARSWSALLPLWPWPPPGSPDSQAARAAPAVRRAPAARSPRPPGPFPPRSSRWSGGAPPGWRARWPRSPGRRPGQELPEPGPGQFLYVRSEVSWLVSWEGADGKNKSYVDKIHPREVWMSPDGRKGWLIEPYKEAVDHGGITLDDPEGGERTLNSPSYDYLRTLPPDPETLLKKIYDETRGMGNGPDQQAFSTIGDLLREQVAPPKLAAGLYRAAARIPGVVLVDDSVDAAGRHGIAIARTDEGDGSRTEWIFDRETYTYLGERTVQTRDAEGIKAGTVKGHTAVTDRAVVDAVKQRPAGSAPGERAPAPATPSAGT